MLLLFCVIKVSINPLQASFPILKHQKTFDFLMLSGGIKVTPE